MIQQQTGLILFTHNGWSLKQPLRNISGIINLFQTGRLTNNSHTPTHTAQTIILDNELYVIDSDTFGIVPKPFSEWKEGRVWIQVFNPNIIKNKAEESIYIKKLMSKSGTMYDFQTILPQLKLHITGKYTGYKNESKADDKFICSELTAWAYNYRLWYQRSPINLYNNRYIDAPNGFDIISGAAKDIHFFTK